jgi:SAM-dependent methyltransferase
MPRPNKRQTAGWEPVADWYDGWVGKDGSEHHRRLALPAVLDLLDARPGMQVLDVGAGQGVLAPHVAGAGARYTGVDISPRLLALARKHHGPRGRFIQGDARYLAQIKELEARSFDAVVYLLSIEDMNPLEPVIESAAWALKNGGWVVILMRHPCFRVPRQSGWGFDEGRSLLYRRVDRYLSPLSVPMKTYGKQRGGATISFHRPLQTYVNTLAANDLYINHLREIPTYKTGETKAEQLANEEFPLFLALRAVRLAVDE